MYGLIATFIYPAVYIPVVYSYYKLILKIYLPYTNVFANFKYRCTCKQYRNKAKIKTCKRPPYYRNTAERKTKRLPYSAAENRVDFLSFFGHHSVI